jgi:cytochrome c oxidase subunit 2
MRPSRRRAALLVGAAALLGCRSAASALEPRGPEAAAVATLWWVMLALGGAVFGVVTMLVAVALLRGRGAQADAAPTPETGPEASRGQRWVLVGGVGVPVILLTMTMVLTLRAMAALAGPPQPADLTVEITGRQFWWEIRYPEQGVVTANELHVPVGRAVRLRLTSADVIHSFWVPQLKGKMDLVPGIVNETWLQADHPGVYRGRCAEYCGVQHARMDFLVVAQPPDELAAWVERQRRPAAEPTDPDARAGMGLFMQQPSCVRCHTIRGTPADGREGPDLTHVGSRRTIASGMLPNNPGTLAGWIADPQGLKPGNKMPDDGIDVGTARLIAAYLDGLR